MQDKKLCFVIGPIGEPESEPRIHADWLLEGIIEPVLGGFPDFKVKRADQDPRPGLIDAQLINDLLNAELVIADLSFLNPNVYYEIGIRHMAQKPIIHMQLATEKPPFDLSLYRAIKFSRAKYRDLGAAQAELRRAIDAALAKDYEIENPVTNARGKLKLDEQATSAQRIVLDQLEAVNQRLADLEDRSVLPRQTFETVNPRHVGRVVIKLKSGPANRFEVVEKWLMVTFDGLFSVTRRDGEMVAEILGGARNYERARFVEKTKKLPREIDSIDFSGFLPPWERQS